MERKSFSEKPCSIARSLDVLGDWWSPMILRECLYGINRFDGLQRWLGVSRNILTRRLTLLVEQELLSKRCYQDRPPRYEYHLTEKGFDACRVLLAMMPFGERWYFGGEGKPVQLYDQRTGQPVTPVLVDQHTGEAIDPRHLIAGPGPAFPASPHIRHERFSEYYAWIEPSKDGASRTSRGRSR
ncbi:MAG: helix-turn-helix domain-containing protein [Pseudomonadota bacterium]